MITHALAACFLFNRYFLDCGFSSDNLVRLQQSSSPLDLQLRPRMLILSRLQKPGRGLCTSSSEPEPESMPSSNAHTDTCDNRFGERKSSESEWLRSRGWLVGDPGGESVVLAMAGTSQLPTRISPDLFSGP